MAWRPHFLIASKESRIRHVAICGTQEDYLFRKFSTQGRNWDASEEDLTVGTRQKVVRAGLKASIGARSYQSSQNAESSHGDGQAQGNSRPKLWSGPARLEQRPLPQCRPSRGADRQPLPTAFIETRLSTIIQVYKLEGNSRETKRPIRIFSRRFFPEERRAASTYPDASSGTVHHLQRSASRGANAALHSGVAQRRSVGVAPVERKFKQPLYRLAEGGLKRWRALPAETGQAVTYHARRELTEFRMISRVPGRWLRGMLCPCRWIQSPYAEMPIDDAKRSGIDGAIALVKVNTGQSIRGFLKVENVPVLIQLKRIPRGPSRHRNPASGARHFSLD